MMFRTSYTSRRTAALDELPDWSDILDEVKDTLDKADIWWRYGWFAFFFRLEAL
jgi:hypothetical protein